MADHTESSIVIAADPGTVVDVIGDVEAYPEWTDQMRAVTVLTTDDAGWPDQAEFTVDAGILQDTYVLEYEWDLAEDGIGVTVVHPGGIRTRIAESARTGSGVPVAEYEEGRRQFAKLLRMPPEDAAAQIVAAIERRRPRLLIGWTAKVPDVLVRLLPGTYWRLIARRAAPAKRRGAA